MTAPVDIAVIETGALRVTGRDRVDLLHRLSTNDLRPLQTSGAVGSTVFTTHQGRIVDWAWLVARADVLWVRTSAGRASRLAEWIGSYTITEDVETADVSGEWRVVVARGEGAADVLGIERPRPGHAVFAGNAMWQLGLDAYGDCLEGLVPSAEVEGVLGAAVARGARRIDEAELELARLRAGVPSPEHEFKEEVNPLELRLVREVSFSKGCYIGQEVIARMDSYDKVARYLIGFEGDGAPAGAAPGSRLLRDGKAVGRVTSLARLPSGGVVGLAVVKREAAGSGTAELATGEASGPVNLVDRAFWS